MRLIESTTSLWWSGGVAGTDAAALCGCAAEARDHPLSLWAAKIWQRERQLRKELELEQGTPEWHNRRRTGIGGTEAAAVVGAAYTDRDGNTTTALDIFKDKTGEKPIVVAENYAMKRGKELEPLARTLYEELYGWSTPPACVLHQDLDYVRASLDGLRGDDKLVVEIKSCGPAYHQKLLAMQQIEDPLLRQIAFSNKFNYYRYQVLWQLLITDADVVHFVGYSDAFDGHQKLAVVELYPEPVEQERLLNRVREFWEEYVEKRIPPPIEFCLPYHRPPTELRLP